MKLIKWAKEHKIWAGIIAIGLFLLPILIVHILFKIAAPCKWLVANWTAGDVLLYCGAVLGATATIMAIILTIISTQENQKDERKLSIKPHLQTEYRPINKDQVIEKVNNRTLFVMYPNNESESISTTYELPYLLTKPEKKNQLGNIISTLDFSRRYKIIQYPVSNVGVGNALNLSFTINNKPVIQPFSLTVNNTKMFVLIFESELLKDDKEHSLLFKYVYQDIASIARYKQQETLVLVREDNALNLRQHVNDVISQPKEI